MQLVAKDAPSTGEQTEYEFVMLSTAGGAVCSSSGIPVWTQRLSSIQAARVACIVAFDSDLLRGPHRFATTGFQREPRAADASNAHDVPVAGERRIENDRPFGFGERRPSITLPARDIDCERRDACLGSRHAIASSGAALARDTNISDRIRLSASWLRENHTKRVSIAEAATVARMSERNFMRRFKQEIGVTPSEFIRRIRLEEACQMLAHTDLPADKIARRTGFTRGNQMARIFRQYLEMSPTEYRHKVRSTRA
ncbi:AraC family transcriptional regulator [Burkholderia stabilis]|nr:AraC family transcriptional regulator [Burkholderia stabilis]